MSPKHQGSSQKKTEPPIKKAPALAPSAAAFDRFFTKQGMWILLALLAVMVVAVFKDFLLLHKFYLFRDIGSDSITINFPSVYHIADYLKTDGIPLWSFKQGLGQNILPGSLSDPFYDIMFLFGKDNIIGLTAWFEFLKIFCAGLLFYLFLRKVSVTGIAAVVGAAAYAFSGFMILAGPWQVFSDEAVYIALLLLSFEKLFQDNDWRLFPVAVWLITSYQPFFMYIHGLFLLCWAALRLVESGSWRLGKSVPLVLKMAGLGTIGVVASAFFSVPIVEQILNSPRSGAASYVKKLSAAPMFALAGDQESMTSIMRLFSNDLMGSGSFFFGWSNYLEAPLFYCGLVNLLLVPQLFFGLKKHQKIGYGALLLAYLLMVAFPWFRRGYWLFSGDYYRTFGLLVTILLIVYSVKGLTAIVRQGSMDLKRALLLAGTLAVLLIALYFPYPFMEQHPQLALNESLRTLLTIALVGYACLVALTGIPKIRNAVLVLILVATGAELAYSAYVTIDTRRVPDQFAIGSSSGVINDTLLQQRQFFNDYTIDATNYLNSTDKGFFRVYKNFPSGNAIHMSINDPKVQGFNGLGSYHSFNQKYYVRFLGQMGLIDTTDEWQTRWLAPRLALERMLHSLVSLKYQIVRTNGLPYINYGYDSIGRFGDVSVWKNRYSLPLGFTYDAYLPAADFATLSKDQKMVALQKAFIAENGADPSGIARLPLQQAQAPYTWESYEADFAQRKTDTLAIDRFAQNTIHGTITVKRSKLLFFSIPYDKGWSATVDGKLVRPVLVNIGFLGIPLDPGSHTVGLRFMPPNFFLTLYVTIAGILIYFLTMAIKTILDRKKRGSTPAAQIRS